VKCRRTIGLWRIHIRVLLHQLLHGCLVPAHDGVGNLRASGSAQDENRQAQQHDAASGSPWDNAVHRFPYRFVSRLVLSPMLS
jgi:hypothetical protein